MLTPSTQHAIIIRVIDEKTTLTSISTKNLLKIQVLFPLSVACLANRPANRYGFD